MIVRVQYLHGDMNSHQKARGEKTIKDTSRVKRGLPVNIRVIISCLQIDMKPAKENAISESESSHEADSIDVKADPKRGEIVAHDLASPSRNSVVVFTCRLLI